MLRLGLETLEGRDLMSSGIASAAVGLTAPVGSTKGSIIHADAFTPPIGSDKGSVVAGIASGGLGTAGPYSLWSGPAAFASRPSIGAETHNGIIAILIG